MKSITLIISVATLLVSCKKTYVCNCKEIVEGPGYKSEYTYIDKVTSTKKDKDSECLKYMDEKYRSQYGSDFDCTANK